MPIPNPEGDYTPPEQFDAGQYDVRWSEWMTVDDDQSPIFIAQSGRRLTARYRTVQASGDEGPPGSADRGQVPLLVKAFGGDVSKLPPYNQPNQRLIIAGRIIKEAAEMVRVTVGNGGWIGRVAGMELPPGYYRVACRGIVSTNDLGEPSWKAGQYGNYFTPCVEILSDSGGNVTPWDHVRVYESLPYPLVASDGQLEWEARDDGVLASASYRVRDFFRAVCPTLFDAEFDDINNVLPEADRLIQEMGRVCIGMAERSARSPTRRVILRLGQLAPISESVEAEEVEADTRGVEFSLVDRLYDILNDAMEGNAFGADGKLTDDAKKWWNGVKGTDPEDGEEVVGIVAFARKYRIPRVLGRMSDDDVKAILAWMGEEESGDF